MSLFRVFLTSFWNLWPSVTVSSLTYRRQAHTIKELILCDIWKRAWMGYLYQFIIYACVICKFSNMELWSKGTKKLAQHFTLFLTVFLWSRLWASIIKIFCTFPWGHLFSSGGGISGSGLPIIFFISIAMAFLSLDFFKFGPYSRWMFW